MVMMGCAGGDDRSGIDSDTTLTDTTGMMGMGEAQSAAVAQLSPTEGNEVTGTVTFTSMNGGVHVEATVSGLQPGRHGFHIHENGDCSAPDASSAGGHFSPQGNQHGAPDDQERHVGDLGNLDVAQGGTARYSRMDSVITLGGANSIVGKAVVVHADEDDLTTQPSGNAGARVACGVIEMRGGQMPGARAPGGVMPGTNTDTSSAL